MVFNYRGQSKEFPHGGTKTLTTYSPGAAFGELALLGGPTAKRKAGIVAEEGCTCKHAPAYMHRVATALHPH